MCDGWNDEHMILPDPGIVQGPHGPRAADPWEMPNYTRRKKKMPKRLRVRIFKGGKTEIKAEGFDDSGCLEASKPLREAIGGQQKTTRCNDSSGNDGVVREKKELE